MFICNSPQLFAAYHVLLRLREPRHPPCALLYFLPTNTYARVSLIYTLYRFTTYFIENMSKIFSPLSEFWVENTELEPNVTP